MLRGMHLGIAPEAVKPVSVQVLLDERCSYQEPSIQVLVACWMGADRECPPSGCCLAVLQGSRHQQMIQEEELRRVDLRRRMRATVVPTSDAEVRRLLRQLGEPVTFFGEQQASACPQSAAPALGRLFIISSFMCTGSLCLSQ